MKIAFLTPEYPHLKTGTAGGIGTSIKNLAAGLVNDGAEVSILVYGQSEDEVFIDQNITFYRIRNIRFKGFSRFFTQKKIQRLINSLIAERKIEIVEAPDWTGITSFIKPNCQLVVKLHGSDTYFCHLDNRPVKWINRFHEKRALLRADALLSVSQYTADVTSQLFGLQQKFTIIPNGVNVTDFISSQTLSAKVEKTILYFGTLIRKKGLLELPLIFNEVYKRDPEVKLLLIGRDGSDIQTGNTSLWQMMQPLFSADALKNVAWLGSVSHDQIKEHIANATVCVFPTFAEALPVSWIEAMAMQKPIVASNIGWANELIDDGVDGFLVHPKSHIKYAEQILNVLENRQLAQKVGSQARKKTESHFDIAIVAKKSAAFYNRLLTDL